MLGTLLPGLRELRAPLAAGYLWLAVLWLWWGDGLQSAVEDAPAGLDRLNALDPVVSDLGLAVVASVAAYIVGSIAIDVQVRALRPVAVFFMRPLFGERIGGRAAEVYGGPRELPVTERGRDLLQRWLRERLRSDQNIELIPTGTALAYIRSNRDLIKIRLLDVSQPLHSEIDRPDAEATFRMAFWPPLTILVIYLAVELSWLCAFALVVPALLAAQWISLRRHANDALVAALLARKEVAPELKEAIAGPSTPSRPKEASKNNVGGMAWLM